MAWGRDVGHCEGIGHLVAHDLDHEPRVGSTGASNSGSGIVIGRGVRRTLRGGRSARVNGAGGVPQTHVRSIAAMADQVAGRPKNTGSSSMSLGRSRAAVWAPRHSGPARTGTARWCAQPRPCRGRPRWRGRLTMPSRTVAAGSVPRSDTGRCTAPVDNRPRIDGVTRSAQLEPWRSRSVYPTPVRSRRASWRSGWRAAERRARGG